jgi:GxxExxY protein
MKILTKDTKMKTENTTDIFALCDIIRQTAFELHAYLRHGQFEKVYENGLANRLRKKGLTVFQQHSLPVRDEDGTVLGDYLADLFVNDCLIVELKAVKALADEHTAQVLGYLRASGIEHGLLIYFGAPKLEVKKYVLSNE